MYLDMYTALKEIKIKIQPIRAYIYYLISMLVGYCQREQPTHSPHDCPRH